MRPYRSLAVLVFLLLVGCAAAEEGPRIDRGGWVVRRAFLPHSQDSKKTVELFWTQPAGDGPYPAVLFIHGHQEQARDGGESFVRAGRLGVSAGVRQFRWPSRLLWPFHPRCCAGRPGFPAEATVGQPEQDGALWV